MLPSGNVYLVSKKTVVILSPPSHGEASGDRDRAVRRQVVNFEVLHRVDQQVGGVIENGLILTQRSGRRDYVLSSIEGC